MPTPDAVQAPPAIPPSPPMTRTRRSLISRTRVNDDIRISPVRLIDAEGEQVGIVSLEEAKSQAASAELDLVEVAAQARPPVVKIMDWGRHQYEEQKKAREARKKQHTMEVKEVQLRPRTDDHDFEVKLKRARRFLSEGNAVRVVLRFRGRELRRPEVGVETLERMLEATKDIAKVENFSKNIEGRRLSALLEPQTTH
jgi:translation initiation factor IF-3